MKVLSKVVPSLAVISVMTLVEFILSSPSSSQVKSTYLEAAKTFEGKVPSSHDSPLLVSQLTAPAYSCLITVQQPNATPPTANYNASLTCSVGRPGGFVLSLYNSNVNFPTDRRYIGPNRHDCTLTASSCGTPTYARSIDRTQHLWVYAGVNIVGSDGRVYTRTDISPALRTYNNRGASYPFVKPTRSDMPVVPFPSDPPYVQRVPRAPNFADELRKLYIAKKWTIPTDAEAHHIKPIAWGGGNDPSANGVFLGRATHQLFTTWWASFSNLNW